MKARAHGSSNYRHMPEFFSNRVAEARRFCLDLNPPCRKSLTVVCAGIEQCAPDYAIHRESFGYYCIEYVARGQGQLKLDEQKYTLRPGDVFSYGHNNPHDIGTDPHEPLVKYFVDFAGTRAAALLKNGGLQHGHVMRVFPCDCLVPFFDELISSGLETRADGGGLCTKLLECIALKIAAASTPSEETNSRRFLLYQQCRSHISSNYLRLKTLTQIAEECRLDESYICRLFRRYDRQSPYQFLIRLKINRAIAELQQPGSLVKNVAAIVGFNDAFHFSRQFHRIVGVWPSEFRSVR
jgi:AraC-like DNA-binding protein